MKTKREREKALRKVEIATDKMVDLQSMGFGSDTVARILEMLNSLNNRIASGN